MSLVVEHVCLLQVSSWPAVNPFFTHISGLTFTDTRFETDKYQRRNEVTGKEHAINIIGSKLAIASAELLGSVN